MPLSHIVLFTLIPAAATLAGGALALLWAPGARLRSGIQHLAAGIVFAAVATELLPEMAEAHSPWVMSLGFAAGVAAMLGVKLLARRGEAAGEEGRPSPAGLVLPVAVDLLIDGLLVGLAFTAGERHGWIITAALTLEVVFLGMSTAASLGRGHLARGKILALLLLLAALLVAGGVAGATVLHYLPHAGFVALVAFAVAALLYLVTEELLVEAHEEPDTPWVTALFFAGFLAVLLVDHSL